MTGGIVLCGGRSSRMGRPKAWLPVGGERMLQRVVRVLREVVEPVVVVAAPGQDVPPLPGGVRIVRDEVEGRGPLAGLVAGLEALNGAVEAAYLSSCDVPFLNPVFVSTVVTLLSTPGAPVQISIPGDENHLHPLAAAYRLSVLPEARRLLAESRLRPVYLLESCTARIVGPSVLTEYDPGLQSLRNVNTPEDYQAALRSVVRGP